MPKPLISVVIPAYNVERYLGEAIESVLGQTYEPVELIVVDDGSTDTTAEVASSFAEVKLIQQPNRGLAAARNAGFEASAGRFICFHDADDQMTPDKLSKQVDHLRRHAGCGIVLAHQRLLLEEGAELPFWARGEMMPLSPGGGPGFDGEGAPHTMTMLMRREVFETIGSFDETLRIAQDIDWLFRAYEEDAGIEILDDILLVRRVHSTSLTQDDDGTRREVFEVFKKRIDRRRRRAAGQSPS